jgi:Protein of unknown function (DUF4058)
MPIHDWKRVDAGIFHDFHNSWITEIRNALNKGILPEDYYALGEQIAGEIGPDVLTLHAEPRNGAPSPSGVPQGATALAVIPPKVRFTARTEMENYTSKQRTIVIRHRSGDQVIALLEILSLGNKSSTAMFDALMQKAISALSHGIHLLLIDLYPPTPRDPDGVHGAVWWRLTNISYTPPLDKRLTLAAYKAGHDLTYYVEPVALGDALPDMPLFLTSEAYVSVPLEATYRAAYAGVPKRWRAVLDA